MRQSYCYTYDAHGELRSVIMTKKDTQLPSVTEVNSVGKQRNRDGRFAPGNTVSATKRIKLGQSAVAIGLRDVHPMYAKFVAYGKRWASIRRSEFEELYGGELTIGVATMLDNAGYMLALSRFFDLVAREHPDQLKEGPELFKKAVSFLQEHRNQEEKAREVAVAESRQRKKKNTAHVLLGEIVNNSAPSLGSGDPTKDPV